MAEPSLGTSLLLLADEEVDELLEPLLADDDAPDAPVFNSPALPGYCARDIDGIKIMPLNPANANMAPHTHTIGRLSQQTIKTYGILIISAIIKPRRAHRNS